MRNINISQCPSRGEERKTGNWPVVSGLTKPSFILPSPSLETLRTKGKKSISYQVYFLPWSTANWEKY